MKIEDGTAVFKSEPYYFKQERDGLKPNTVRLLTRSEKKQIRPDVEPLEIEHIKKIRIECTIDFPFEGRGYFTRTLTSIEQIGELCGYYLFVFSWRHDAEGTEDK